MSANSNPPACIKIGRRQMVRYKAMLAGCLMIHEINEGIRTPEVLLGTGGVAVCTAEVVRDVNELFGMLSAVVGVAEEGA